jgi:hypothetical protein
VPALIAGLPSEVGNSVLPRSQTMLPRNVSLTLPMRRAFHHAHLQSKQVLYRNKVLRDPPLP